MTRLNQVRIRNSFLKGKEGGGAGADPGIYVLARASLRTAPGHAFILRILMTTKRCKKNN